MSLQKRVEANRANAKRSTGPRTLHGKSRSRANAVRHGLSSRALKESAFLLDADSLAKRIAREHGKQDNCFEAATIAEAELTILRVRTARAQLLDLNTVSSANASQSVADSPPISAASRLSVSPDHLAHVYLRALPDLIKLDRYERRALSRRREALRFLWSG
jgi:hypothetical protein